MLYSHSDSLNLQDIFFSPLTRQHKWDCFCNKCICKLINQRCTLIKIYASYHLAVNTSKFPISYKCITRYILEYETKSNLKWKTSTIGCHLFIYVENTYSLLFNWKACRGKVYSYIQIVPEVNFLKLKF